MYKATQSSALRQEEVLVEKVLESGSIKNWDYE